MSRSELPAEVIEQMVAHLRKCAAEPVAKPNDLHREMLAIVALLPKPVDPDLIEARALVGKNYGPGSEKQYHEGRFDTSLEVETCLAGIRLGRKLQKEQSNA